MSVGARLREERLRLGLSQPAFAALAGVTKGALVKWEKDTASPNALALTAFSEAGADAFYILSGRRTPERRIPDEEMIEIQLAEIERDLLEPKRHRLPNESDEDTEQRILLKSIDTLEGIIKHDCPQESELNERAWALLNAASSPPKLALLRAADFVQKRKRREEEEELLGMWLQEWPYQPDHAPMKLLAMMALEYGVPHSMLVELSQEIAKDVREQDWADSVIRHDEASQRAIKKPRK